MPEEQFPVLDVSGWEIIADETAGAEEKAWCEKGTAWRFEHDPGRVIPTLVEMTAKALRLASPEARRYWPERFRQVDQDEVVHVLARVPRMSDPARTFAGKVLEVNRRRVLDACT